MYISNLSLWVRTLSYWMKMFFVIVVTFVYEVLNYWKPLDRLAKKEFSDEI
jgi:hypothetical protein